MQLGNTMSVTHQKYVELRRSGRVRGGDPMATASEPTIYTDENGIDWTLSVSTPQLTPLQVRVNNRQARRAAQAQARRTRKK